MKLIYHNNYLLNDGDHFDDTSMGTLQKVRYAAAQMNNLACFILFNQVCDQNLVLFVHSSNNICPLQYILQ